MGERTPVAVLDAPRLRPARGRRGDHQHPGGRHRRRWAQVRLSANWMAACGEPGEDAALYAAVRAVGEELCPALGIAIPVGKDSLSMRTAGRKARPASGGRAGVADRLGLRAGAMTCGAPGRRCCSSMRGRLALCSSIWRGPQPARGSALAQVFKASRRRSRRTSMSRSGWRGFAAALVELRARGWCLPTTIAPTADCW